ncbi:MAG TPA: NAD(P)H-binding protein [Enhygromyxa sp.]|nr:NAD(P)H-binding protein [Enhygromyxa sp.]
MPARFDHVLLTGATGFVGRHLHPVLLREGYSVRGASRDPDAAELRFPGRQFVRLDLADRASIADALAGCDAAIYLVHTMAGGADDYEAAELRMAADFLAEAERAGIRRIVYLGGIRPTGGHVSKHLRSRLATGEMLRSGSISTIELQASMIIGRGSESWRIVRDLAMRLPIMVLPRWLESRTEPIAIADVTFALTRALELEEPGSVVESLPGPEVLSGREMLERVAALRDMKPRIIEIPLLTPRLSSYWIRLVTRADRRIATELVEGLTGDLLAPDRGFWRRFPEHERIGFDEAAELALVEEQRELSVLARLSERAIRTLARPAHR